MDQQTANALADELGRALREVGLSDARAVAGPGGEDLGELVVMADGVTAPVVVMTRADFRPVHASQLPEIGRHETGMVFADRIAERTRIILRERGWGWLDRRRGHLRLWQTGLRIDTNLTPRLAPPEGPRVKNPFSPAGRTLALWLLLHPDVAASPRGIAREIGVSAGQISTLLSAFSDQALLRRDKRPLVPELFWALVEQWSPRRYAMFELPDGDADLQRDRWLVTDSLAATAAGAPLVLSGDYPPDLYVPDEATLQWILARGERARDPARRVATVAVAPTNLVFDPRFTSPPAGGRSWRNVHPTVAALDLATDLARGREVVEAWNPELDGAIRVW